MAFFNDILFFYEVINPFLHAVNLQQTALKHIDKNMKNLHKWALYRLIELKTLLVKEKLLIISNFFIWHNVFKKLSAEALERVYMWERLNWINLLLISLKCLSIMILSFQSQNNVTTPIEAKNKQPILEARNEKKPPPIEVLAFGVVLLSWVGCQFK